VDLPALRHLLAVAFVAALGASGAGAALRIAPVCAARDLEGSFRVVPGSAGAGNIVYALRLRNVSRSTCYLMGVPAISLLGRQGRPLPTHAVRRAQKALAIRPGRSAVATARFSPDVPGQGEQASGPCEPLAYRLRLAAGPVVPIVPPTRVCERGTLTFSLLAPG
jgi:hypothetical protein